MFRGTPYLNRNIKKREQQRSMDYHMNNLHQVRPRTGTLQPTISFPINNRKGELQKQTRFTQIQRQNRLLLQKISSIMGKNQRKADSQKKLNKSLNSQFRKRQLQNIEIENAKLLRRLQQRKSNYQTEKFKQSWKKQKYVIKNLSNYPFIINDRKNKRTSVSQIGNRQPKNIIQLYRVRVIDGVNFLITIRMNQQKLQIIGDTKDKKQIKVIQIQRKEAIQFIDKECGGKIQKVFDSLRYDKVDEVLYLVANDIQLEQMVGQDSQRKQKAAKIKFSQNPQFDISTDLQQKNGEASNNHEIPIVISNGDQNKKYWMNIEDNPTSKIEKNEKQKADDYLQIANNNKKGDENQQQQYQPQYQEQMENTQNKKEGFILKQGLSQEKQYDEDSFNKQNSQDEQRQQQSMSRRIKDKNVNLQYTETNKNENQENQSENKGNKQINEQGQHISIEKQHLENAEPIELGD